MSNTTSWMQQLHELQMKAVLSMTPCFLFLYINMVMLVTLLKKSVFQNPRYILFAHLLFSDSLQLVFCVAMYMIAVTRLTIDNYVCLILCVWGGTNAFISPLNLAAMSLERYIAICFPLRYSQLATIRRTEVFIAVVWILGSFNSLTDLFFYVSYNVPYSKMQVFCSRYTLLSGELFMTLNKAFTGMYFVVVGIIIIYTYVAIMIAAKSASSNKSNASKALQTIFLHMIQLGLCLTSTLFNIINVMVRWTLDPQTVLQIQYVLFLSLIIFPKCLSPLIYGLRDKVFRNALRYYLFLGSENKVRAAVTAL